MVRIGEYSPNFPGNRPGSESGNRGIFGFGEYEEKRKHYNEQRKLEFKQYIAQQTLKVTCSRDSKNKSYIPTIDAGASVNENVSTSAIQREVATQTVNRNQRDASTNTDVSMDINNYAQSNDDLINHRSANPYKTDTRTKKNTIESGGALLGNLKHDSINGLTFQMKNKDCRRSNAITAAYERDLRAQIEEKKNHARALERREQLEAESRERWIAEEASRELERHKVEEKRIKALEDYRRQSVEEFRNRSEQLQREAKEIRRMKMRDRRELAHNVMIGAESDANARSYSLGEVTPHQTPKYIPKECTIQSQKSDKLKLSRASGEVTTQQTPKSIPKVCTIQSQKSDKLILSRDQSDTQESHLEQGSIGQELLKTATANGSTPKACLPHFQSQSNGNILSHLGEIRRQLTTKQMKMEAAVKKINSPDATKETGIKS